MAAHEGAHIGETVNLQDIGKTPQEIREYSEKIGFHSLRNVIKDCAINAGFSREFPAIIGGWLEAKRPELVAPLPDLKDASVDVKLRVVEELPAKLEALREWARWDRRTMDSVAVKTGYQPTETIKTFSQGLQCIQALPDGRILLGGLDSVAVWSKGLSGNWTHDKPDGFSGWIHCVQALPDGRIVSGGADGHIRICGRGDDGRMQTEVLRGHDARVSSLHALPSGMIISASWDSTIRIWRRDNSGEWRNEALRGHTGWCNSLEALADGRLISAGDDGTIRIWCKDKKGVWGREVLRPGSASVYFLHVLPDGRMFSVHGSREIRVWHRDGAANGVMKRFAIRTQVNRLALSKFFPMERYFRATQTARSVCGPRDRITSGEAIYCVGSSIRSTASRHCPMEGSSRDMVTVLSLSGTVASHIRVSHN